MVTFTEKFTGAKAHLFAKVCEEYMEAAEVGCNDDPARTPIFSWLSPYQRLQLVKQVMVGLLCPDVPFPPGTIQHLAAYYGLVEFLKTKIEVELDFQWHVEDVGEDLRLPDEDVRRRFTDEEISERGRNRELIRDRAEKNKKKLDKKDADDYHFHEEEFNVEESLGDLEHVNFLLFGGRPLTKKQRKKVRTPSTKDEKDAFHLRLLCDAAFQEDNEGYFPVPPLAKVNFDFRSNNDEKWRTAVDMLFVTFSGVEADNKESTLALGAIDDRTYADVSEHARIQTVKKHISILRKLYESMWDANLLAQDQRCIYAVCSNEKYGGYGHGQFVHDFVKELARQHNIDLTKPGNYQVRYDMYKEMVPSYQEGLKHPFHAVTDGTCFGFCRTPINYTCDSENITASCHKRNCWSSENLKACSKCKVICYCSRECQVADWPDHKKHCKEMAKLRKDKETIAELAKNM